MSKRQQVLENERKLIEKLQSNMLDELDLELDGDMPEELLEAIRNAHDETVGNGGSATNEVTTGQPYRLSDSDDFPFGTYVQNQTGRIVTKHFRISDEYQILLWLRIWGLIKSMLESIMDTTIMEQQKFGKKEQVVQLH
jgi:hypothetical protein